MKLGECPVVCLGKEQTIFKQYIFAKKMWTNKGKCRLVPKDEGYGIMISAFQSQEFVFGYPLTVPDLQTINEYHNIHPKYVDTDAENTILVHTQKEPTAMGINPFCQGFEYGTSAKVYWDYYRMVLQLEYCTEILNDIHPSINFIFLFNHPYVHDI